MLHVKSTFKLTKDKWDYQLKPIFCHICSPYHFPVGAAKREYSTMFRVFSQGLGVYFLSFVKNDSCLAKQSHPSLEQKNLIGGHLLTFGEL